MEASVGGLEARDRLNRRTGNRGKIIPNINAIYETASREGKAIPEELKLAPGR